MTEQDPQTQLGEEVRARRVELGLSVRSAAAVAQISRRTWQEVEAGERVHVRIHTLNAMDRVLGFPAGTLAKRTNRGETIERRVVVELRTRPNETVDDVRAREQLAYLAGSLSTTNVYRTLAHISGLPDDLEVEAVERAVAMQISQQDRSAPKRPAKRSNQQTKREAG